MEFSFVQITDHHVRTPETALIHGFSTNYAFKAVMQHICDRIASQIDFIVSTGDLVEHPSEDDYNYLKNILGFKNSTSAPGPLYINFDGCRDFPVYLLPGNHDDRDWFYRTLFPLSKSTTLLNTTFLHKGVQFICLDWGPQDKGFAYPETLSFLKQALVSKNPSIILMHHHTQPVNSKWLDRYIPDGIDEFWHIVSGKSILGIFCGHVHASFGTIKKEIPFYTVGSTGFQFPLQDEEAIHLTPPQYRFVKVTDNTITSQVIDVPLDR